MLVVVMKPDIRTAVVAAEVVVAAEIVVAAAVVAAAVVVAEVVAGAVSCTRPTAGKSQDVVVVVECHSRFRSQHPSSSWMYHSQQRHRPLGRYHKEPQGLVERASQS